MNAFVLTRKTLFRGQILFALLALVLWSAEVLRAPFDPDYAAGEIYDHIVNWSETGQLYVPIGPTSPYRVLNYPPAFLAAVRVLQGAGLPPLLAGRLLCLVSIALALVILRRWLLREGCRSGTTWLLLALLAGGYPAIYFAGQLHIQWPAVLCTLLGFYLLSDERGDEAALRKRALLAGCACALACFVKHSQFVPGLIAAAYLLRHDRRRFLYFTASGVLFGLAGAALLEARFGNELWRQVLTYSVGRFALAQLGMQIVEHVVPWGIVAAAGLWLGRHRARDLRWWYFAGSLLWLLSSARLGAGPQYFTEWCCTCVLWIGPPLDEWLRAAGEAGRPPRRPDWAILTVMAAQLVWADAECGSHLAREAAILDGTIAPLPTLCGAMPPDQKLVAIEEAAVARACKHQAVVQPFIMSQLSRLGLWDATPFLDRLEQGSYPVVILPFDPFGDRLHRDRWTDGMLAALVHRYVVSERSGDWVVLRPAPRPAPEPPVANGSAGR